MSRFHSTILVTVAFVPLLASVTLAQSGRGRFAENPRYDPATEITLQGTVEEVFEVESPRGGQGVHLRITADETSYEVSLGPASYVTAQDFVIAAGDDVTVIACPLAGSEGDQLIAREVRKGEDVLTLRDEHGFPAWSRGRPG